MAHTTSSGTGNPVPTVYLLIETKLVEKKKSKRILPWKKKTTVIPKDASRLISVKEYEVLSPEQKEKCTLATPDVILRFGGASVRAKK